MSYLRSTDTETGYGYDMIRIIHRANFEKPRYNMARIITVSNVSVNCIYINYKYIT